MYGPWRRLVGLGAVAPADEYAMLWTPGAQLMAHGSEAFTHDGPINTEPSHDLAHLIVAANGTLQWRPAGSQPEICFAEYNAVMLEHLYDRVYRSLMGREFAPAQIIPGLLSHGSWFVTKHFTPFPATPKVAAEKFRSALTPRALALAPYFFDMKNSERGDAGHMQKTWTARFGADDRPTGWSELQNETARQVQVLKQEKLS